MKTTAANLVRWAGLPAMAAGILFVVIQPLHPPQALESVTTGAWAIVHYLTMAMCLAGMLGITGIYARQAEESGWLGLAGYLLLGLWLPLTMALVFVEAFVLPHLTASAPQFVQSFLALAGGAAGEMEIGALATVASLAGVLYVLGGFLFGIATLRASILSRWAAGLLAIGSVLPLAIPLVPHQFERFAAVPMGIALAWLGYSLWSERREASPEAAPGSSPLVFRSRTY